MKRLRVISLILASTLVCNTFSFVNVNAAAGEKKTKVDIRNIEKYHVEESVSLPDGYELSLLNVDNNMVYAMEGNDDGVEIAYNVGDITYYERYENDKLVETEVYTDEDFDTQIEELSLEDEKVIDDVLNAGTYDTAEELETELRRRGIEGAGVVEEDGTFMIDPFANSGVTTRATPSENVGLGGLESAFPKMNQKVSGSKKFNAKPSPTVSTTISCKDTRNNYVNVKNKKYRLSKGLSVVTAASKVLMSLANFKGIFSAFISLGKIAKDLDVNRSIEATANASRNAWMYDRTNYKKQIIVYGLSEKEKYAAGVPSDNEPYGWYALPGNLFQRTKPIDILNKGIEIWQYNMDTYGKWR